MKKLTICGLAVLMLMGLFTGIALSAKPPVGDDVTVNAVVDQTVWLDLGAHSVDLQVNPDVSDSASLTANVRSNWNWQLVAGSVQLVGVDGEGSGETIPAGMLTINGSSAASDVTLASAGRTGGTPVDVTYALDVDWSVAPGAYTDTHTCTLSFQ